MSTEFDEGNHESVATAAWLAMQQPCRLGTVWFAAMSAVAPDRLLGLADFPSRLLEQV